MSHRNRLKHLEAQLADEMHRQAMANEPDFERLTLEQLEELAAMVARIISGHPLTGAEEDRLEALYAIAYG